MLKKITVCNTEVIQQNAHISKLPSFIVIARKCDQSPLKTILKTRVIKTKLARPCVCSSCGHAVNLLIVVLFNFPAFSIVIILLMEPAEGLAQNFALQVSVR